MFRDFSSRITFIQICSDVNVFFLILFYRFYFFLMFKINDANYVCFKCDVSRVESKSRC